MIQKFCILIECCKNVVIVCISALVFKFILWGCKLNISSEYIEDVVLEEITSFILFLNLISQVALAIIRNNHFTSFV